MTENNVIFDIDESIVTVTFNDPDRRNPISHDVKQHLIEFLSDIATQEVHCVVFQGAGSAFSSGGDIDSMKDRRKLWGKDEFKGTLQEELRLANQLIHAVYTLSLPTIAKLDGPAVGSGAALALACDVRLASEDAKLGFGFRHVGLSVDSGVSFLLPRIVGLSKAKDLTLTGEPINAPAAYEIGLVDQIYEDSSFEEESQKYVETIASGPTVALKHIKQLMNRSFSTNLRSALESEMVAQEIAAHTEDHAEGVDAFLENRAPSFQGQ